MVPELGIEVWAAIFVALVLIATYLLKRFTSAETWYVIAMLRTKRVLPWIDGLARGPAGGAMKRVADAGILLGFGGIAVDSLYGRELPRAQRILVFAASAALLTALFYLIDFLLAGMFSTSPFTKDFFPLLAAVFGISGFAGFTVLALVTQAVDIIAKTSVGQPACPGVAPLIPGIDIPGVPISVPMHAWISLFIILAVHEGSHGIVARKLGIKLKSAGLLLLGFFPVGAFVEQDDKQLKAAPDRDALRVYAAGPAANLLSLVAIEIAIIAIVLVIATFLTPWAAPIQEQMFDGVVITGVDQNVEFCKAIYPAPAYGVLDENTLITKVNGTDITSAAKLQVVLMQNRYKQVKFTVENMDGSVVEHTIAPNELGTFGFSVEERRNPGYDVPWEYEAYSAGIHALDDFLGWLFILSLLVGLVNFLPLVPFDGGRMANILFVPYFSWLKMGKEDTEKLIGRVCLWGLLALLAINALPLFL